MCSNIHIHGKINLLLKNSALICGTVSVFLLHFVTAWPLVGEKQLPCTSLPTDQYLLRGQNRK